MKVKVLLGTATIALVSFVGAVHTVIGQDMPDVPQTSVTPIVEAVEEPRADELIETHVVAIVEPEKNIVTNQPVDIPKVTEPYWIMYIKSQSTKGGLYLAAYDCMLQWESHLTPMKVSGMHKIVKFMNSTEAEKDAAVEAVFEDTYQTQPCAEMPL